MKKILLICLVIFCASILQTKAQLRDTTAPAKKPHPAADLLFLKAKKQKSTAWLFVGTGGAILIVGTIMAGHDINNAYSAVASNFVNIFYSTPTTYKSNHTGGIVATIGAGTMLASIPFFISAGKNKRHAQIMLKNEHVYFNPQLDMKQELVALGLKINL